MSTKTSIKRIAAVAAVALTFGGLSAVSANATTPVNALPNSVLSLNTAITNSTGTAAPTVVRPGQTVYLNWGGSVAADQTVAPTASLYVGAFTAALTSYPASGYSPVFAAGALGTAAHLENTTDAASIAYSNNVAQFQGVAEKKLFPAAATVTSSATGGQGSFSFLAKKAGSYTVHLFWDANNNGTQEAYEVGTDFTVTVTAYPTYNNARSTAYLVNGNGTTAGSSASDTTGYDSYTIKDTNAAAISVTLNDATATGVDLSQITGITATAEGHGFVAFGSTTAPAASVCQTATYNAGHPGIVAGNRTLTAYTAAVSGYAQLTQNTFNIYACADGTAGTGTITIKVTDSALNSYTLAVKNMVYYGPVTKIALVAPKATTWVNSSGTFGSTTEANNTAAYIIKATDANGNLVPGLTIVGSTSDSTKITASVAASAAGGNWGGAGYYGASVTTNSLYAAQGDALTVGFKVVDPAGDGTTYLLSDKANVVVVGKATSVKVTLDSASYNPGDKVTVTLTATDSKGNPIADYTSTALVGSLYSTLLSQTVSGLPGNNALIVTVDGKKSWTLQAPIGVGTGITVLGTVGLGVDASIQGAALSATASVSSPALDAAQAAQDAANEATDAANAATDAANNAMDSADAATAAAQDAGDKADAALAAITDLATKVSDIAAQVSALSSIVAKIAAAVAKISKKVKA
jgi:hypothetical protein